MSFPGVVIIDTRFVRPLGDIGNPDTFARLQIPVRYRTVGGASPQRVVRDNEQLALTGFLAGVAQGCEFQRRILDNELAMGLRRSESDVIDATLACVAPTPKSPRWCSNAPICRPMPVPLLRPPASEWNIWFP